MAKQELNDGGAGPIKAKDEMGQPAQTPVAPESPAAPRHSTIKRKSLLPRLVLVALAGAGIYYGGKAGYDYWTVGRFVESTDDAYVAADITYISPKISNYVLSVPVHANQAVKAGDVLVQLDDGDLKLALASAENKIVSQQSTIARIEQQVNSAITSVGGAQAQVVSAEADLRQANLNLTRQNELIASAVVSQATLDSAVAARDKSAAGLNSARANLDVAVANVDVLKAQVTEAENALKELVTARDIAARNLSFAVVKAPFDGTIGNMAVQKGDFVSAAQRLAALVPLSQVRIDANFKESQIGRLKPGQPVSFTIDAFPDRVFKGTVDGISPASGSVFSLLPAQNATGNFTKVVQRLPVRIAIPADEAAEGIIRPGMSAVVTVDPR